MITYTITGWDYTSARTVIYYADTPSVKIAEDEASLAMGLLWAISEGQDTHYQTNQELDYHSPCSVNWLVSSVAGTIKPCGNHDYIEVPSIKDTAAWEKLAMEGYEMDVKLVTTKKVIAGELQVTMHFESEVGERMNTPVLVEKKPLFEMIAFHAVDGITELGHYADPNDIELINKCDELDGMYWLYTKEELTKYLIETLKTLGVEVNH